MVVLIRRGEERLASMWDFQAPAAFRVAAAEAEQVELALALPPVSVDGGTRRG